MSSKKRTAASEGGVGQLEEETKALTLGSSTATAAAANGSSSGVDSGAVTTSIEGTDAQNAEDMREKDEVRLHTAQRLVVYMAAGDDTGEGLRNGIFNDCIRLPSDEDGAAATFLARIDIGQHGRKKLVLMDASLLSDAPLITESRANLSVCLRGRGKRPGRLEYKLLRSIGTSVTIDV